MGESLAAGDFAGGASLSVPIPFPPARGIAPPLALSWQSGGGAGVFGMGVDIGQPAIVRQTSKRIPRYDADDVFMHAGFGELVPTPDPPGQAVIGGVTYTTRGYRPRLEQGFPAIDHLTAPGRDLWRVVDGDNWTSLYGTDPSAQIADPADPARVFAWLLQESFGPRGDHLLYDYKPEDGTGDPSIAPRSRANRYLAQIHWGNRVPTTGSLMLFAQGASPPAPDWCFHAAFDYGEYDTAAADPWQPSGSWTCRADPFSRYDSGFEVRTARLCRTILIFHDFPDALGATPLLVTALRLGYDESPHRTLLTRIAETGFRTDAGVANGARAAAPLAPIELLYSDFDLARGSYADVATSGGTAVQGADALWVDLFGGGIPGLLQAHDGGVRFWPPDRLDPARSSVSYAGPSRVAPIPNGAQWPGGGFTLADVTGSGRMQWLSRARACPGFAEIGSDAAAGPFHGFERIPVDIDNPARQIVSVTGTGLPDLLLIAADRVEYTPSLGAVGYGDTVRLPGQGLPPYAPEALGEARRFADICGSGQHHLVRIRNGSVTYWPNLGYGRFGAPVAMANAPWFDSELDPSRLYLADLDGTGAADLLYLSADGLRVWRNRAGNGFDDPVMLPLPAPADLLMQLDFVDLLGSGLACLVVTQPQALVPRRYLPINGGVRPFQLVEVCNNLGRSLTLDYTTSAQSWMRDRAQGVAWLTTPPSPVLLLAALTDRDALAETVTTRSFIYRHGYYDPDERNFTGFAFVEERDAEDFPDPAPEDDPAAKAYQAPPNVTRRWRHTGALPNGLPLELQLAPEWFQGDPKACPLALTATQFVARDAEAVRQACFALRGQMLREEDYGVDDSAVAATPYVVETVRHQIQQLEPPSAGGISVFRVDPLETLHYEYERSAMDPRVSHGFTLARDDFGNVTQSVSLAYPRRTPDPAVPAQAELIATQELTSYLNVTDGFRLIGIVGDEIEEAIDGLTPDADGYLTLEALRTQLAAAKTRRFAWTRHHYAPGPGGAALSPQALPVMVEAATFECAALTQQYAPALGATDLTALLTGPDGGYRAYSNGEEAGYWWNPGTSLDYAGADGFYLPVRSTDPLGGVIDCSYDASALLIVHSADLLGNVTTVEAVDYQALAPARVRDPNQALCEVAFDALGLVATLTAHGSEGGTAMGFAPLSTYQWPAEPPDFATVLAAPASALQGMKAAYFYDPLAWCGLISQAILAGLSIDTAALWTDLIARGYLTEDGAICTRFRRDRAAGSYQLAALFATVSDQVATLIEAAPASAPVGALSLVASAFPGSPVGPIVQQIVYTDGLGRLLQTKSFTDEGQPVRGQAAEAAAPATAWLTSGAVRYNAKGDPVRRFEPWFSGSCAYDPLEAAIEGASTIFYFDALGRFDHALTPLGAIRRQLRGSVSADGDFTPGPWDFAVYDENDTLKSSPYYQALIADPHADPCERAAALRAALADGSPTRTSLDPLGRPVRTRQQNDGLITAAGLESLGYPESQADTLLAALIDEGQLDARGAPTMAFAPGATGWTLPLPPPFTDDADKITTYIAAIQRAGTLLATVMTLDIRGNPLRIADPRLAATGVANYVVAFALNNTPVCIAGADSGTRRTLANAIGAPLYARDAIGNVLTSRFDQLGRPAEQHLVPATSGPAQIMRALYGDSARAATPGAPLVPYFTAPERWNLRGKPVMLLDSAGLLLAPFATFQGFESAHAIWIRKDPAALPDWGTLDDPTLQILADAITALPDAGALASLSLPASILAVLDDAGFVTRTGFDALGRITAATDAGGNVEQRTINVRGLLAAIDFAPAGGAAVTSIGPITYDAHARPLAYGVDGAFATTLDYDPRTFQLTGIATNGATTADVRQALTYYRDPIGNVMFALDAADLPLGRPAGAQPTQAFTYDLLYQLITATGREGTPAAEPTPYAERFDYDAGDNLVAETHSGGLANWTRSFIIAAGSNRLDSLTTTTGGASDSRPLAYDANGNQTALPGLDTLAWNYLDRIATTITSPDGDGAFEREDHIYSGTGTRVRTRRQYFAGANQLPVWTEEITYLDTLEITRTTQGDTTSEQHLARVTAAGRPVAQWLGWISGAPEGGPAAAMSYPLLDVLGSVRQLLDAGGAPLMWREYLPYGADSLSWTADDTSGTLQRRRFGGEEFDPATGLYRYALRDYAPSLMRWLSPDPAGAADTLNGYRFVHNNPATFADDGGRVTIHHWNVKDKNTPALNDTKFIAEMANQLAKAVDHRGTVVFLTEVMASVSHATFSTFLDKVQKKAGPGWKAQLIYAGVSEGGWRREKIAVLTHGLPVQNYFQLVCPTSTSKNTIKEVSPTATFTHRHQFNERQIVGVDVLANVGGETTMSIGAYHNQGPSSGAETRASRWRQQGGRHRLHAVTGDWNTPAPKEKNKRPTKRLRGDGFGGNVTFDQTGTSRGGSVYDYTLSFNSDVNGRELHVENRAGPRLSSSDHRPNSAVITTRKRTRED
ncbi:hypothetical protein CVN68_02095 [Sphingomonas psychrotolerans]|uniref:Insecticidal toxin complex protein n=2 Tax=Sphingomonas psychrotolerans TaxID=1327635 RepID=A0A2K8MEH0_9SPHN|nr:hypothetical protein CVN68_02095 [Sphingomonas psychrotolerans]